MSRQPAGLRGEQILGGGVDLLAGDFIAFLEQVEEEIPARMRVICILDDLSTHTTH
ncbi:MAG: hypothetical protein ACRDLY_03110 [Thermoleophilaceae bacterium]